MTPFWISILAVGTFMVGLILGVVMMALCAMASKSERDRGNEGV